MSRPTEPAPAPKSPLIVCRDQEVCDDLDLKLSKAWLRIAIAGVFAGQGMMFSLALNMTPPPFATTAYWILHGGLIFSSLVVIAFLGGPLFASTWSMLRYRRLSIEGLFTLSLMGAFVGSVVGSATGRGDVFYEIVAIVIAIYTFGRMLSERSQSKLRLESARLRERFDSAHVVSDTGGWMRVPLDEVSVGTKVRIDPGEAISVDGRIVSGQGFVVETALTGEPLPVVRHVGECVRAGTYTVDCRLEVVVEKPKGLRELDALIEMVESTDGRPSELQTQANDLIQKFLPLVVGVALTTAVFWAFFGTWVDAVLNSMAVLLVACPCALGLATPVAISQGLYRLARMGLVSRDGALIDVLARTERIFFDKTGTLSESSLRVTEFWASSESQISANALLAGICEVESSIKHPVAVALSRYIASSDSEIMEVEVSELRLLPGQGVEFALFGHRVQVGEASLCGGDVAVEPVIANLHDTEGKRVFVTIDGNVAACFVLKESFREGIGGMWGRLHDLGLRIEVLTGDPTPELKLPKKVNLQFGLSSEEKVQVVQDSLAANEEPLFVGDGINDAAAMSTARGSIAMGSGSGLTVSVGMGQLRNDQIDLLPDTITLARKIHARLRGNLIYAASYNVLGMALAAAGVLHPVAAALIMLISSFFVTTRALRF